MFGVIVEVKTFTFVVCYENSDMLFSIVKSIHSLEI